MMGIPCFSAAEEGKGKKSKRKRVRTAASEMMESDAKVSEGNCEEHVGWFARVVCAGDVFPPINELDREKEFVDMAQTAAEWVAKSKRMTLGYHDNLTRMRAELALARARVTELEAGAAAKWKDGEGQEELERQKAEMKLLKSQVRSFKGASTRARKTERDRVTKCFQERDAGLTAKAAALKRKLALDMMYQGQTKSNLELVDELRRPESRSLDEIEEELRAWSLEYAGAQVHFDDAIDELVDGFSEGVDLGGAMTARSVKKETAAGDID